MTTTDDTFEEPVTVEGVPQVHKDGRIHVHSKTQRLAVTWLAVGSTGSEVDLVPAPAAEGSSE